MNLIQNGLKTASYINDIYTDNVFISLPFGGNFSNLYYYQPAFYINVHVFFA